MCDRPVWNSLSRAYKGVEAGSLQGSPYNSQSTCRAAMLSVGCALASIGELNACDKEHHLLCCS
jgi:hypothetical protein